MFVIILKYPEQWVTGQELGFGEEGSHGLFAVTGVICQFAELWLFDIHTAPVSLNVVFSRQKDLVIPRLANCLKQQTS